jgi:uncharacterized membrane protein (TIGR02234 family)
MSSPEKKQQTPAVHEPAEHHHPGTGLPRWKRKSSLILLAVASSLVVFGTTTQTWVHVKLAQGVVQQADLNVAGSKAATAVTALALVALAGALASSIAGRVARIVAAVIVLLSAAGIVASSVAVLVDPQGAAAGPVGTATGVTGVPAEAATTAFPAIAVASAVALALAAALIGLFGRNWTRRTKYDPAASTAASTAQVQERGADQGSGSGADEGTGEPLDDIDSWDQLSRGTDPTS